ncbi:uncharacterized protein VTP21DRAFT_4439 [Calcarisporiella thermophila]|uniref:uncharacterized protein n=1 Tax=Calcarisporiella thermophila TaxID=911321 RepID=UPI003743C71D
MVFSHSNGEEEEEVIYDVGADYAQRNSYELDELGSEEDDDLLRKQNSSSLSLLEFNDSQLLIPLSMSEQRPVDLDRRLGFFSGLGLVIGLMIGSGIFASPGPVLAYSHASVGVSLLVWIVGGLLAMTGAFSYVELGTTFPQSGGEALYLEKAFGGLPSFLFSFVAIVVLKPGSLAIITVVFAEYICRLIYHTAFDGDASDIPEWTIKLLSILCILVLTVINAVGVKFATRTQDMFTILKLLAMLAIAITGIVVLARGSNSGNFTSGDIMGDWKSISFGDYALALYSALWSYDGWNNLNYVSGEMKDPARDLPRIIGFGIPLVIVCYIITNVAYYAVLPAAVVGKTTTIALEFGKTMFGPLGGVMFAICVALSCFGAANASVFTGARLIYVSARQGHIPSIFGKINAKRATPVAALILQMVLTIIMIVPGSFHTLVNLYGVTAWLFYFLTVVGLIYLRIRAPELKRSYRTWITTPLLFCLVAIFLLVMPFTSAPIESLIGLSLVLLGLPFYLLQTSGVFKWCSNCCTTALQRMGLMQKNGTHHMLRTDDALEMEET